jgi:alcohol dehydrogenase class IV
VQPHVEAQSGAERIRAAEDGLPACAREAHQIRRLLDFNPVNLREADILDIYEAAY